MATTCEISTAELTVARIAQTTGLEPLRADWNALSRGVPFRSFDWLENWWKTYGRQGRKELFVLTVRDQGTLLGLAPWYIDLGARRSRVIRFLGSGEVCSDYLTVLARTGCEDRVAVTLADWLCPPSASDPERVPTWDVLQLGNVNQQDATLRPFVARLAERGLLVCQRDRSSCWRVHLPARWEDYLASLSKSHRKQLRRLERKYFSGERAHLHTASTRSQVEYGLDVLSRLHQRRRESLGERGCFASRQFAAFHAQTALELFNSRKLRLVWLDVDGRTVAAEYQVLGDGVVYAYQSGIEPSALRHEPGRLITLAMLKLAIAEGYHAYDFLRGDELYKAHWRAVPRPTFEVRIAVDTPVARLRQGVWWASGLLRGWIQRESRTKPGVHC